MNLSVQVRDFFVWLCESVNDRESNSNNKSKSIHNSEKTIVSRYNHLHCPKKKIYNHLHKKRNIYHTQNANNATNNFPQPDF